ncbi:uncharacterized protein Dana_GF15308 [Drosophila ananassae]|uniref:Ig-like domain-containing protein n=1 Tax=Drosophila ananassae TaxID=7217 RepID=B3MJC9_DROAN|nr:uncharacterized protein LOC6498121 [Drosophila ananassae]XP_044571907.1 uncharacterized protein LOC6498121 [Drosophila ananassae]EDV31339.2 uncharacterized protein Dana_GF15308 [Drosophila ananassae]
MPAAIVIVKQHRQEKQQQQRQQHRQQEEQEQEQEQEQRKEQHWGKQICNINLCGFLRRSGADDDVDADVLAIAITNITATSSGATATSAAKATSRRTATTTKITKTTATRTVIIIMALVVSIIQQQQQQQLQQQKQQEQQSLLWPFYNGLFAAAAATRQPDDSSVGPTLTTFLSSSESESESLSPPSSSTSSSSSLSFAVANGPQTDATNHTFKSLAFLDASFGSDLFAHQEKEGIREMQRKREREKMKEREKDTETNSDTNPDSAQSLPIFDFGMPRNITGRTGHTEAIIKCRVDSLHDKSVSWIRKRDLHILTVGTATYTTDKRFQVTESKDSREWTLHVKSPQAKDTGIYECQVNTEPKMSMAFQLNIIEISPDAKAVISGPHDLHFKAGSAIILNCVVQQPSVKDIGPIYWYRGEHMITPFDADDGPEPVVPPRSRDRTLDGPEDVSPNDIMSEVDLQKEFATRIAMESQLGDTLKSRLRISNAQTTDTGNYTCQPTTASSASVLVHVINDENPAAMQKSGASAQDPRQLVPVLMSLILLMLLTPPMSEE